MKYFIKEAMDKLAISGKLVSKAFASRVANVQKGTASAEKTILQGERMTLSTIGKPGARQKGIREATRKGTSDTHHAFMKRNGMW